MQNLLFNVVENPLEPERVSSLEEESSYQEIDVDDAESLSEKTFKFKERPKQVRDNQSGESNNQYGCQCRPRILVVDDNSFNILAVKLMLKDKFNLDIHEALDGKFAVEMFNQAIQNPCRCPNRAYKIIFMDLSMPIMSGQDASRHILELQGEQDLTRIVALTAFTNSKTHEECGIIGIKKLIKKPLSYQDLHSVMHLHFFRMELNEYKLLHKSVFDEEYNS